MRELYVEIYGLLLGAPASFTVTTTPELRDDRTLDRARALGFAPAGPWGLAQPIEEQERGSGVERATRPGELCIISGIPGGSERMLCREFFHYKSPLGRDPYSAEDETTKIHDAPLISFALLCYASYVDPLVFWASRIAEQH